MMPRPWFYRVFKGNRTNAEPTGIRVSWKCQRQHRDGCGPPQLRPAAAPNGLLVQIFHSADRRVAAETFS